MFKRLSRNSFRAGFVLCAALSPLITSPLFASLQSDITAAENAGGGTVQLAAGTTTITSTLVFQATKGKVELVGAGMGASVISYVPSGTPADAIQIQNTSGAITDRIALEDLTIDVSSPVSTCMDTASMAAIHAISTEFLLLKNVEIVTRQGCSTDSGQTAISLDGTGEFSADTTILNPRIVGDFKNGVLMTGDSTHTANATTIVGGALVNTTQTSPASGTVGINVQFGDTTAVFNTDVEDWDTGVNVAFNSNGPFSVREEGNTTDWKVASGVNGTSFEGATFSTMSDSGMNTIYSSHVNGGVVQTKVASGFVLGVASGGGCVFNTGAGSPNGNVVGNPCDVYLNTIGGTGTTLYVKETGTGTSAGWVAK